MRPGARWLGLKAVKCWVRHPVPASYDSAFLSVWPHTDITFFGSITSY